MDDETAQRLILARIEELKTLSAASAGARATVALDQQSVGRLSRMDALQSQALAAETERRRALELARLSAALRRVDEGTFGECLRCGEEIEPRRLESDPAATLCAGCARATQ